MTTEKQPEQAQGETLNLSQLNALLAPIKLDAAGLHGLGIQTTRDKNSTRILKRHLPILLRALDEHLGRLQDSIALQEAA